MKLGTTEFIEKLERRRVYLKKIAIPSGALFDSAGQYLNSYNLYLSMHDIIPSKITLHHSEVHKIIKRIENEFAGRIIEKHYMRYSLKEHESYKYTNVVFILTNEIIIEIEMTGEIEIYFNESSEEEAFTYENEFAKKINGKENAKLIYFPPGRMVQI